MFGKFLINIHLLFSKKKKLNFNCQSIISNLEQVFYGKNNNNLILTIFFLIFSRKVVYPSKFERKIFLSKKSFTKLLSNIERFTREMTTEEEPGDKLPLTTWQGVKVVNFDMNGEKYLSIGSSKRNNSWGEVDPTKTVNLTLEEFQELAKFLPQIDEVLKKDDCDDEDGGEKPHIDAYGLYVKDESNSDEVPDELINVFSLERQATKGLDLSAEGDDRALVIKRTTVDRPSRVAVTAKVISREIEAYARANKVDPSPDLYAHCDKTRIQSLVSVSMRVLGYQRPYACKEMLQVFTYMDGISKLFTSEGTLKPNAVECPMQDHLLLSAYEEALNFFPPKKYAAE